MITFLTDFGLEDDFVGICHGVIARICPAAQVIDLTHGIRRHDVRGGALTLARALGYVPAGVHLAVVDPGVGTSRRAVAVRAPIRGRQCTCSTRARVTWRIDSACGLAGSATITG